MPTPQENSFFCGTGILPVLGSSAIGVNLSCQPAHPLVRQGLKPLSDCRTVGLSDCRTVGLSDYRTIGLSDYRTIGLSDYRFNVKLTPMGIAVSLQGVCTYLPAKVLYSGSQINEVYRNPEASSFSGQNSYLTFLRKAIYHFHSPCSVKAAQ